MKIMNEDVVADLKQCIVATISQETFILQGSINVLREDISTLERNVGRIDGKIDTLSAAVAEALDGSNEATEMQVKEARERIIRLERKVV